MKLIMAQSCACCNRDQVEPQAKEEAGQCTLTGLFSNEYYVPELFGTAFIFLCTLLALPHILNQRQLFTSEDPVDIQ